MILLNSRSQTAEPYEQHPSFLLDVLDGLGKTQKEIPCKYFYDERGSMLFTEICRTAEYYITRTELKLLGDILPEIAARIGSNATVIEYGSGEGRKIRDLLHALHTPRTYIPIDISAEILFESAHKLKQEFPTLAIYPIVADYTAPITLPDMAMAGSNKGKRVVFFPGSTISNFTPPESNRFLSQLRQCLQPGDVFLLGADLIKSPNRLHQAYNDYDGVTADFNLNILQRINRELGGNFKLHQFEHYAFFNSRHSRIEMHLMSLTNQVVKIGRHQFSFCEGETIHTENSYKYSVERIARMGSECGFGHEHVWMDSEKLFSVHFLSAK